MAVIEQEEAPAKSGPSLVVRPNSSRRTGFDEPLMPAVVEMRLLAPRAWVRGGASPEADADASTVPPSSSHGTGTGAAVEAGAAVVRVAREGRSSFCNRLNTQLAVAVTTPSNSTVQRNAGI